MKKQNVLSKDFFSRSTPLVARELLGKVIYRQKDDKLYRAVISETEAYQGIEDLACHCSKGKTARTEIMFEEGGHIYIYLIYGMYHMLNFVTMPAGFPAAVLIRGVREASIVKDNKEILFLPDKTDGPGKLTRSLEIDKTLNRKTLGLDSGLWVCDEQIRISEENIGISARIGIDYAGEWRKKPWRFFIK